MVGHRARCMMASHPSSSSSEPCSTRRMSRESVGGRGELPPGKTPAPVWVRSREGLEMGVLVPLLAMLGAGRAWRHSISSSQPRADPITLRHS